MVATEGASQPRIWASPRVEREYGGWDDEVVRQLADYLGWPSDELPYGIEAGNVLIDHASIVLGADIRSGASDVEWQRLTELLSISDRTVRVCVQGQPQPIFHLDLYLTLAGPHAATGKPLALVGSMRQGLAVVGEEDAEDLDAGLNAVADYLVRAGYMVERLPLVPFRTVRMKKHAHFSYNNCLVEIWRDADGSTRRRVTLPAYGNGQDSALDALDRAAVDVWEGLGFEVKIARGEFALVAELYGSVRCMTKVLERADRM
jgi:hypothetical protein